MAIKSSDAIAAGRALLGTPYSELDCINFIKKIIRTAPGGVPGYSTAGTNTLWNSYNASAKYRDLTWRQEGVAGARAGQLAFKGGGDDVPHVGLCTGEGTVLHSSSAKGCVVETDLYNGQWTLLANHRYIDVDAGGAGAAQEEGAEGGMAVLFRALVNTQRDGLNVRDSPSLFGKKLGELPCGATVDVYSEGDGSWWCVGLNGLVGYASSGYLHRVNVGEVGAAPDAVMADAQAMCGVPRSALLALADAANALNDAGTDFAALSGRIGALILAAAEVTACLKGDD